MKKILLKTASVAALLLLQSMTGLCFAQTDTSTAAAVAADTRAADTIAADTAAWAVPVTSVVNIRCKGDYDGEMETQALLGMPMKILKNDRWAHVMTPDGDKGYILSSAVEKMTDAQMRAWNAAPQVVVTSFWAFVYEKPDAKSLRVSDVVAACRLKLLGKDKQFYHVALPDGRKGYLPMVHALPLEKWRKTVKHDAQSIIATALSLSGVTYHWGGTSVKAVDCSGLVRTVLLMQPGDLVFFGRKATDEKPAHVSHVGIYMGNQKFIHSLAWVHVSSFNPADPEYDEYDLNRLLWAQRILPQLNTIPELKTNDNVEFYNVK